MNRQKFTRDRSYIPVVLYVVIVVILLLASCSVVYNPLPGLCYTDKTGTYVCPSETIDPLQYDRNTTCRQYYLQNEEEWRWCMDPQNDHIYDPYWKQRKEIERQLPNRRRLGDMYARAIDYNPLGPTSHEREIKRTS